MGFTLFNKKKKEEELLVGASLKMQTAARMRELDQLARSGDAADYSGQHFSQTVPYTIGFVLGVLLSLVAMESNMLDFSGFSLTGIRSVDSFIFGNDVFNFFHQADIDKILTLFLRGFIYCLIAYIIPAFGLGIVKLGNRGQIDPFTACWCALLAMPFIYIIWTESLMSMVQQLFKGF